MMVHVQKIKNNRINQLMEVLEEVEGKAVIWAHYRYDIEAIVERYYQNNMEKILLLLIMVIRLLKIDKKQLKKYRTLILQLDLLLAHHKQVVMELL
jgi:hypothetical protein